MLLLASWRLSSKADVLSPIETQTLGSLGLRETSIMIQHV